ncbi:hypothetical protein TNIN_496591 [Trichonephila inaurata madagascariensis]|uniref:Uncharacterized protein n=1 Tax=Trichonephila inaurata madagascariensis TaxID=2747483 RepID=A0A8X6YHH4_9ARAC|nr:hypothetical protein TNIN_496591 [Trichonephila inaurata madagascariensis]
MASSLKKYLLSCSKLVNFDLCVYFSHLYRKHQRTCTFLLLKSAIFGFLRELRSHIFKAMKHFDDDDTSLDPRRGLRWPEAVSWLSQMAAQLQKGVELLASSFFHFCYLY